jgi:hypothetical protein
VIKVILPSLVLPDDKPEDWQGRGVRIMKRVQDFIGPIHQEPCVFSTGLLMGLFPQRRSGIIQNFALHLQPMETTMMGMIASANFFWTGGQGSIDEFKDVYSRIAWKQKNNYALQAAFLISISHQ